MAAFVALVCEAAWWRLVPAWLGLAGVALLYAGLVWEARAVRRLFADHGDRITARSYGAARSMMLTRALIAVLALVVVALEMARFGR
jgi:hypothetical protein